MVCLDTSFLVDLLRKNKAAQEKLKSLTDEGVTLTTTSIAACELFKGSYKSKNVAKNTKKVRELLSFLELLDLNPTACETYGKLAEDLRNKGELIGDLDVLIASISLVHGEILITKNTKHFQKIPELILDSW